MGKGRFRHQTLEHIDRYSVTEEDELHNVINVHVDLV
jgi:hypothetical protein